MGCLASEMESAALFIAGALRVHAVLYFRQMLNQEREKHIDNPVMADGMKRWQFWQSAN